jgi:hypothetical protein
MCEGLYRSENWKVNYYGQSKWQQHNTETNSYQNLEATALHPETIYTETIYTETIYTEALHPDT